MVIGTVPGTQQAPTKTLMIIKIVIIIITIIVVVTIIIVIIDSFERPFTYIISHNLHNNPERQRLLYL